MTVIRTVPRSVPLNKLSDMRLEIECDCQKVFMYAPSIIKTNYGSQLSSAVCPYCKATFKMDEELRVFFEPE